ncbi:uncharacterized protein LOC141593983 [Silene latifolia]|uniref:uncharacterized protein LOC141593983 n=1 Tax=Silene latifolia TaxID=37657 RepID=UPI003D782F19
MADENKKMKMRAEWRVSGCATETKEKEKEKIFVQVMQIKAEKFYVIDTSNGCVKELPDILNHCMNSITSIGSVIYLVGGLPSYMCGGGAKDIVYATYMFYLDTNSESDPDDSDLGGWKEIPPYIPPADAYDPGARLPNIPVGLPTAVSLAGKIYIFPSHKKSPSALVFNSNTNQNQWDTLLPPSEVGFFDITSAASAFADPDNNRLVVSFKTISSIYAYYPSDNTWELIVDSFGFSNFVFVKGVFYVYLRKTRDLVMAFDSVTKQWLEIEFTSEPPEKMWRYKFKDMLLLGNGLMCLVYSICKLGDSPGILVSVAKFRFKRCTDRPGVLIITPLPMETYKLNTISSILDYYPF